MDMMDFNRTHISYSESSVQIFPALSELENSEELYFKFSKNSIKVDEESDHPGMRMDFDLCLLDRRMNETIIQLFAIFHVTDEVNPVTDWKNIEIAVAFARWLVIKEAEEKSLADKHGNPLTIPEFTITPDSIRLFD